MEQKSLGYIILFFIITVSILWPKYIVYKVNPLPGLGLDRIFMIMAMLVYIVYLYLTNKPWIQLKIYKEFVILLLLLSSVFFISSLINVNTIKSIFASINFFITGPFIAIYCITFINSQEDIKELLLLMVLLLFVTNCIGIIEFFNKAPLFSRFLITKTKCTILAASISMRDSKYRVQSVFTNPLVYAQFLVAAIPINLYCLKNRRKKVLHTIFYTVNLLLSFILVYYTDSRAGMILVALIPFILLFFKLPNKIIKLILDVIIVSVSLITVLLVVKIANSVPVELVKQCALQGVDSNKLSLFSRLVQLKLGIISIVKHPLFGVGYGNTLEVVKPFLRSIDNYFLTIAISGGITGLAVFLFLIIYCMNISLKSIDEPIKNMLPYIKVSFVNILLFYIILSIDKINPILFFEMGLLTVIKIKFSKNVTYS